jgi:two-component system cell cycle sensor histidine kinase/response regulator CckA
VSILAERGEPVGQLVMGLPVGVEELMNPRTWLSWDTFAQLLERLEGFVGGPAPFVELMRGLSSEPVARPIRRMLGLAASPNQIYTLTVRWLGPTLYPRHRSQLERLPGGRLRVVLELEPGMRGCKAFFRSTLATFQVLPRVLGLREAHVEADLGTHRAVYLITPPRSASLWARLRAMLQVFESSSTAIDELAEQQEELRKSYDALAASYAQLSHREERLREEVEERRRAEVALRESEEKLRQSQKMEAVGRLAGGIAHDFNNLMTAVIGYSELLEKSIQRGTDESRSLGEIRSAAERAASLTGQLLTFSRRQVLKPRIVDMNDMVRRMERMLLRVLGPDVELSTQLDPDLQPIRADPLQIEQVILNLAVNARDAMERGGQLVLSTCALPPDPDHPPQPAMVRLVVQDAGSGMSDEVRSRLFEPFFTTKDVGRGTGLGLATVYGIVQQSGGTISVESELGRGSSFTIDLPVAGEPVALEESEPAALEAPGGSETVLLVEDEETIRRLVGLMLQSVGYRVLQAAGGDEALQILERHDGPLDLLLSDVLMRGLSGPELAELVRAKRPGVEVLLISGFSEEGIAGSEGVRFLGKPFTTQALLEAVREALDA